MALSLEEFKNLQPGDFVVWHGGDGVHVDNDHAYEVMGTAGLTVIVKSKIGKYTGVATAWSLGQRAVPAHNTALAALFGVPLP